MKPPTKFALMRANRARLAAAAKYKLQAALSEASRRRFHEHNVASAQQGTYPIGWSPIVS